MATSLIGYVDLSLAGKLMLTLSTIYVLKSIFVAIYNVTLHPLAKIPGPKLYAASHIPSYWGVWTGDIASTTKAMHDRYGDTVRIEPNFVSFNNAEAWKEIYGQSAGKKPMPKDPDIYFRGNDGVADIISCGDADHARIRRLLGHAFSEAALREQEPLMNHYFDLLMRKLHDKGSEPVNIVRWLNFTTFDIIGDLCLGEPFDALKDEEYHFWIANIFQGLKFARMFRLMRAYPLIGYPLLSLITLFPSLSKARTKHQRYTKDKVTRRLEILADRKDFISEIQRHNDEKGMTPAEIIKTFGTLIIAGSETTGTLLSGAIFHLLRNPDTLKNLETEIHRHASPLGGNMTFKSLANLPYLNACIQEALRMYPPVPGFLPRKVPFGGTTINGYRLPAQTAVSVHGLSTAHCSANFVSPESFKPERWLTEPLNTPDKRAALQPFSIGPRNCLGQYLAMAEMRAILARVVWHFDLQLCTESLNWNDQKVFILWDKPELNVILSPRDVGLD